MKVTVEITAGPMKGRRFVFEEHDTFVFGRSPEATCPLPEDNYISRNHFLLEVNPPHVVLRDLGSLNGTEVNDRRLGGRASDEQRITRAGDFSMALGRHEWDRSDYEKVLHHGDVITAGDTVLRVNIEADAVCDRCGAVIPNAPAGTARCEGCLAREAEEAREKAAREAAADRAARLAAQQPAPPKPAAPKPAPPRRDPAREQAAADHLMQLLRQALQAGQPARLPAFPGYEVLRKLGEGGMGAVFLARDTRDGRSVAIKIIRPDQNASDHDVRRFREREMPITLSMKHPNVVGCYAGDFADGVYYLVMEFVDGTDAARLAASAGGALDVRAGCALVAEALRGLEFIHGRHVVHRDLKPPNILLARNGPGWTPKIADFGLSKNLKNSASLTRQGDLAGSVPFMPPEQITAFKQSGFPADVYSMGATLYTLVTGAFVRDFPPGRDPLLAIIQGQPVPVEARRPELPRNVCRVVNRAVSQRPADRYPTAKAFREALQETL